MPHESNDILAVKIAELLASHPTAGGLSSIALSLENINQRLDKIESEMNRPTQHQPTAKPHYSAERFTVIEAVADDIAASLSNEKTCSFEPNGRPCDHCSMCSSRGF